MKVCIVGAGAIGGWIGTRLAVTGQCQVSAVARGAVLTALRTHGWRLQTSDGLLQAPAVATDRAQDLGPQDVVVLAVKGPALSAAVSSVAPLLGPDTRVLPAINGVPWWFCNGREEVGPAPLQSVDPDGKIASTIAFEHVLGCVVHASTSVSEPGLVVHKMGDGLVIGEPAGGLSARAQGIAELLTAAGFSVTHSADIRRDIWYKLWGNMTMNPVSAITGATADRVLADPLVRAFCSAVMNEAATIGARIGCPIEQAPEERHAMTARLGAFKTSMLQDAEAGRPLELDSIVGVVRELGERLGVATPNTDALLGLTRLFGQVHGIYPKT
ncbi:2-dehydropantoate 2-reductase [Achromobacter sp. GG226]|uniref:2-dehydropantoate 2-reductase n=1 Tax=Verticiella alkaliphila TaxID=2779529 RepID=UPI001C0B8828|nr:2-dehydropantoate 2-reductase [Verticiella sp. GG226]MBU4610675.1 2-dehydropantoate 2-reductase [Verticiella sp. GG226]